MTRHRVPGTVVLWVGSALGLALGAIPQDRPIDPRPAPADIAPYLLLGRRTVPGENDPYFLPTLTFDSLGERLEKTQEDAERTRLLYSLLVWNVYSTAALEDQETRRRLYTEAERLYLALLAYHARTPDPALESDALFLIGVAWAAWKGSLDPLARERLERCSSLKTGHYRLAAEMLVEKMEVTPGLDPIIAKIRGGDDAGALVRLDDALRKDSHSAPIHYWRGVALYHLGRFEEAIGSFTACLAASPDNPDALESRAACSYARKDWKRAGLDWETVIALHPEARGRLQPFLDAVRETGR
jgi:tetratricopeptide (TPR) repeat protein